MARHGKPPDLLPSQRADGGERITLRTRDGTGYNYKVLESFAVWPDENWVTGRVRGRDLLTLQTCTPLPTFQNRLIVRAERV
jgi:sortase A